jgi:Transposase IS66 family
LRTGKRPQPRSSRRSPIAAAINYVLNQWEALNRYTTDGDLHIDNNISERTLKLIGMGRINWLFLGSDKGGQTAAVLFSFTATCKHLRIDTFAYLRDLFGRLPTLWRAMASSIPSIISTRLSVVLVNSGNVKAFSVCSAP